MKSLLYVSIGLLSWSVGAFASDTASSPTRLVDLRCEYLVAPEAIDVRAPRLSWRLEATQRGAAQTAWEVRVASSREKLARGEADLWASGRKAGTASNQIAYAGKPVAAGAECFWQVRIWDEQRRPTEWSEPARWSVGLLTAKDWRAQWISYRDSAPLHTSRTELFLPAARHYRREFTAAKAVRRAVVYASALGVYDLHCNGQRVGDARFQPGWADYRKRAYYRAHDVTALLRNGANALGAVVADGWYAGYVGYGLLVGYGPNRVGRYFYGKTPAFFAQLEIEYADGTRETIITDSAWRVTERGPTREADLIMGETYDARAELRGWDAPGYDASGWEPAIRAEENPRVRAVFTDALGNREVDLGFSRPPRLQAYAAPPIRVTQELPAKAVTEPKPGVYIFDLGQNFAGVVRLQIKGAAGTRVQLRYGEMLHRDGRLMTENLRKARATDAYILRGDPAGETWVPRFTYHGFQYVEVTGLAAKPGLETITGLVLHNDTPAAGSFECSDPVLTQFGRNAWWTQRANFVEMPTDCPQRDERLGWTGDAQAYIRTATYNADTAAFYTKWIDDLAEAQHSFGAYPDYAPYPMAHGMRAGKSFGTGWTDAGIICPWTVWRVYGDTRLLTKHWASMTRFMDFRQATMDVNSLGVSIGNPWGDWLNVNEPTPIEFIDTCYHAFDCMLMAEMAGVLGKKVEAANYQARRARIAEAFAKAYVKDDGTLSIDTQTAYVLALASDLLPRPKVAVAAARLAEKIAANGYRMTTGFLGTRALLPALTFGGRHDLAVRLFQNRVFPSWGYEVVNGANSVWERWDSYTKEHGFDGANGNQNASMNSFSHYAFGAVMEWAYQTLAGIDTEGAGYRRVVIWPRPPAPGSNPDVPPIHWVRAHYDSINGRISSAWKREAGRFTLEATVPPNTTAMIGLPGGKIDGITESGAPLAKGGAIRDVTTADGTVWIAALAGSYRFEVPLPER